MPKPEEILVWVEIRLKAVIFTLFNESLEDALEIHKEIHEKLEMITFGDIEKPDIYGKMEALLKLNYFVEGILNDQGAGL